MIVLAQEPILKAIIKMYIKIRENVFFLSLGNNRYLSIILIAQLGTVLEHAIVITLISDLNYCTDRKYKQRFICIWSVFI